MFSVYESDNSWKHFYANSYQGNFVTAAKNRMEMCLQWITKQRKRSSTERWSVIRANKEKIQDITRFVKRKTKGAV